MDTTGKRYENIKHMPTPTRVRIPKFTRFADPEDATAEGGKVIPDCTGPYPRREQCLQKLP
jgi:hypothetical protein